MGWGWMEKEGVSLRGRAEVIGGVGNPEERTFLREPLALDEVHSRH